MIASSGNRTRAARVAGEHSTTEPTMLVFFDSMQQGSSCGRVVKATDSKSVSLWERRFESYRLRKHFVLARHRWFSGRMLACHAGGPGSIPGRCKIFSFFLAIKQMQHESQNDLFLLFPIPTFYHWFWPCFNIITVQLLLTSVPLLTCPLYSYRHLANESQECVHVMW